MQANGAGRLAVRVARFVELACYRAAKEVWTVSQAMKRYLQDSACCTHVRVVYDRPRRNMLNAVSQMREEDCERVVAETREIAERYGRKGEIGKIVVVSTSWTPDEDMDMFLQAVREWESRERLFTVVVTGNGPGRYMFEQQVANMQLNYVQVWFVWIREEDYARFLSCCHVAVCMHHSSSGLDLPMKVVDYFACRLPVVVRWYDTLGEMVKRGTDGVGFDDLNGLVQGVDDLMGDKGDAIRLGRRRESKGVWEDEWQAQVEGGRRHARRQW